MAALALSTAHGTGARRLKAQVEYVGVGRSAVRRILRLRAPSA